MIPENIIVSLFKNYQSTTPKEVNLWEWLKDTSHKADIDYLRRIDNKEDMRRIKSSLPAVTPSGRFMFRNESGLLQHSGFICIDIDAADNDHIDDFKYLKNQISRITNIAYCGLSASGRGVFCLIPISNPEKHKLHFEALKLVFKDLGIIVDKACGDVSRLRGYSYDPEGYFNLNANTYSQVYDRNSRRPVTSTFARKRKSHLKRETNSEKKVQNIIAKISSTATDITGDYNQWFQIGCAIANEFGEEGREMFHNVSMFSDTYKELPTDTQFDKCLDGSYDFKIGTFFHWAEEYGMLNEN